MAVRVTSPDRGHVKTWGSARNPVSESVDRHSRRSSASTFAHCRRVRGHCASDGVAPPVFHPVPPPDTADLQALVERIAECLGRMLERRGLIERDAESAWLSGDNSMK